MYCMHCALLKHLSSTFFLHLDSDPFKVLTPNLNIFIHKSFDSEWISTLYKTFSGPESFTNNQEEQVLFDKFFIMLTMLKEVEGCQMSLLKQFQRIYCPPRELGRTAAKPTDSFIAFILFVKLLSLCSQITNK